MDAFLYFTGGIHFFIFLQIITKNRQISTKIAKFNVVILGKVKVAQFIVYGVFKNQKERFRDYEKNFGGNDSVAAMY